MRRALSISVSICLSLLLSASAQARLRKTKPTLPLAGGKLGKLQQKFPTVISERATFPTAVTRHKFYAYSPEQGALVYRGNTAVEINSDGSRTRITQTVVPAEQRVAYNPGALIEWSERLQAALAPRAGLTPTAALRLSAKALIGGGFEIDRITTTGKDGSVVEMITANFANGVFRSVRQVPAGGGKAFFKATFNDKPLPLP
ncbi:MAG: hypothetical protein H6707_21645 [Deltaproteobacteria bacterium]|nr:hypothetical protein [Deltaproteobacteria bacterium]